MNSNHFSTFSLVCIPVEKEPNRDPSSFTGNFGVETGHMHFYFDGQNHTEQIVSTHVLFVLMKLVAAVPKMYRGENVVFESTSDPYEYRLDLNESEDTVTISFLFPGRDLVFIDRATVSLDTYIASVVHAAEEWMTWLETHFPDEIRNSPYSSYYDLMQKHIRVAKQVIWDRANEHPQLKNIKTQLADAEESGKSISYDIQALTLSPDDPNMVASDVHYSIDNETFNHTFCDEYQRVASFLGVADTSQDVLMEALQNLTMRTVGDDWVEATLFAEIDEDGHGLTYGRYTSNTEPNLPFDTDYAVYAVFDTLRRNHAEQAWSKAQFVLTPDGNRQFHIGT